MIDYEIGLLIAIFSYVYTNLLTEADHIFNWPYRKADEYLPRWLFYPLIGCEKCNAGQIALWYFVYNYYLGFYFYPLTIIATMLTFVAFTIFTVYTIKQLWEKLKQ